MLFHGRGHDPSSMRALHAALGLGDVALVAPAAPAELGGAWYPLRFVEPRAANEPHLSAALAAVHATLDDLEARGVPPGRVVLGGFSQGACLAADALAVRPRPVGALAALCGGLIGTEAELARPPAGALAGLPVLLTATERDEWVPVERVRATARLLEAAGASVDLRVHPPGPHAVRRDEVEALAALVLSLDNPGRRSTAFP